MSSHCKHHLLANPLSLLNIAHPEITFPTITFSGNVIFFAVVVQLYRNVISGRQGSYQSATRKQQQSKSKDKMMNKQIQIEYLTVCSIFFLCNDDFCDKLPDVTVSLRGNSCFKRPCILWPDQTAVMSSECRAQAHPQYVFSSCSGPAHRFVCCRLSSCPYTSYCHCARREISMRVSQYMKSGSFITK